MGDLYALDFDGVLCDSCNEASTAALQAAKIRWPDAFANVDSSTEKWIIEHMSIVRPVVESGDDFLLLVRLLLEMKNPISSELNGVTFENVLENWDELKTCVMNTWNEHSKEDLINQLGIARDEWIARDMQGWLNANRFYPGIEDSLTFSTSKLYIVTTKEARFVAKSLKELVGVDFPIEHIYGMGCGPKVEVLKQLQDQPQHEGLSLHFVEDRLATLRNVIQHRELDKWNLYLASWGYNTCQERDDAAATVERIRLLHLPDFCSKLK